MKLEPALRAVVVLQWLLAAFSIYVFDLEATRLPPELVQYGLAEIGDEPALSVASIAGAWLLGSLVAGGGVFFFQRWGRALFLVMAVVGCFVQVLLGPTIAPPWSEASETAAQILVGLTIGLVYFSPLRARFGGAQSP